MEDTFGDGWNGCTLTIDVNGVTTDYTLLGGDFEEVTFTVNEGISKKDQYIIISLEVGDWAGKIQKANLPDYLIVDYVKVYKK